MPRSSGVFVFLLSLALALPIAWAFVLWRRVAETDAELQIAAEKAAASDQRSIRLLERLLEATSQRADDTCDRQAELARRIDEVAELLASRKPADGASIQPLLEQHQEVTRKTLAEFDGRFAGLAQSVRALGEKISAVEPALDTLRTEGSSTDETQRQEIDALGREVTEVRTVLDEVRRELGAFRTEVGTWRETLIAQGASGTKPGTPSGEPPAPPEDATQLSTLPWVGRLRAVDVEAGMVVVGKGRADGAVEESGLEVLHEGVVVARLRIIRLWDHHCGARVEWLRPETTLAIDDFVRTAGHDSLREDPALQEDADPIADGASSPQTDALPETPDLGSLEKERDVSPPPGG